MKLFKKEKIGSRRIITLFGMKFEYNTAKKYKFEKVTESGINETPRNPRLIVSLTSFPARIPSLYITLSSLLQQTMKPDMVILWLAREQFPNLENDLPESILKLQEFGLTIRWYHDIRPYKKLIPALLKFPEDIIITVDDDVFYDKKMVELLYNSYLESPENIHCHRITKISLKNGKIKAKPKKCYNKPSFANKLVGVGGVLYPPHSLYKDIANEQLFMKLAPTNDDIWFWLMAVMNDTKIVQIPHNIDEPVELEETQSGPRLCQINDNGENLFYVQLKNVFNHYDGLREKVFADMK